MESDIQDMTDRQILEETLSHMRAFSALMKAFEQNPMVKSMMGPTLPPTSGLKF